MRRAWPVASLALAALVLYLLLVLPNHPDAVTSGAILFFPLELPLILALLIVLRQQAPSTQIVRIALVAILGAIGLLKMADYAMFVSFGRGFNPLLDLHLIEAGWRLLSDAVGAFSAALCILGGLLAIGTTVAATWWATGHWARIESRGRWRAGGIAATLGAAVLLVGDVGHAMQQWRLPISPPGEAFTARLGVERAISYQEAFQDLRSFDLASVGDPFRETAPLLDHIDERDVLFIFVESYGRASFDTPLYAPTHRETLRTLEARLAESGVAMRSAWLRAPMIGGQSWLSHATLANGVWITNQWRYAELLASDRWSLFHFAADAGFRTAAVMPAITLDWPEADRMGFETVLAADDLGYRGQPFNWVTMPDQYTLVALDRLLLKTPDPRPLFAQVALISSHAPWVPIPPLLGWDELGDGTIFDTWAQSGDPPDIVWRDRDRVREQYRKAVDYSLKVVGGYALRQFDRIPLMVVLGDHQTARFVSQSDSFDVPIHIIGPPKLIERTDAWGWQQGLIPAEESPVWRMDSFRDRFLSAFSSAEPVL
ncbi:sulfatase [Pelagibius litoralis]|uniref:Sulfatase n=2 Tax=Pelagibius litoralis TaxID=374515 RepID=A0A967F386_9PROT|nr:sulfatase [Pelagibius litoralis]